jgi:hypothetical protein
MKNYLYIFSLFIGLTLTQQTFAAADPAKDAKQKTDKTQISSGIHDYGTFEAVEKICDICDEAIDIQQSKFGNSMIKAREHQPEPITNHLTTQRGILFCEMQGIPDSLRTPWGVRSLTGGGLLSGFVAITEKQLYPRLKIKFLRDIPSLYGEENIGKIYKVLAIDDKELSEPSEHVTFEFFKNVSDIKAAFKKHQERYKKEKDEQKSEKDSHEKN